MKEYKPRNIVKCPDTLNYFNFVVQEMLNKIEFTRPNIWLCSSKRGWCKYPSDNSAPCAIVIPLFAVDRGWDYLNYYIAHELAHAWIFSEEGLSNGVDYHGPKFMEKFKMLCHEEFWHYELAYKPKLAKAAGIIKNGN